MEIPYNIGENIGGGYDWNLTTTRQPALNDQSIVLPAGKVVGGGSIINGMVWNRGNPDDFNAWEALGNGGWNWNALLPYFQKVFALRGIHSNTEYSTSPRHTPRIPTKKYQLPSQKIPTVRSMAEMDL